MAAKVEERYASNDAAGGGNGTNLFGTDSENIASVILGLGGEATATDPADLAVRQHAAQREDYVLTLKVRNLTDIVSWRSG